MEIEVHKGLKFGLGWTTQLFTLGNVRVHGTTDIKQHQHYNTVTALWYRLYIQNALLGCFTNRTINIQLFRCTLSGKFTQTAQRHLHLPSTQQLVIIQVTILTLLPDFYRGAFTPW